MTGSPALELRALSVDYDGRRAVRAVSLALAAGEIMGVLGESGSGKSTLALAALGLLPASARIAGGEILLFGEPQIGLGPAERRRRMGRLIAYVPQEPLTAMNPALRVQTQMDLALRRRFDAPAPERRARILAWLDRMGLGDPERVARAYPFELSGGQTQRAMLALAFALEPRVILADEPTTALDVTIQAEVLAVFAATARETGVGVLFISHDVGVVGALCDRVLVMRRGEAVETGPTSRVLSAPEAAYTQSLLAALPGRAAPRTMLAVETAA